MLLDQNVMGKRGSACMQKITPFMWFNNNAKEAMDFYVSVFKNSKVLSVIRYGEEGPGAKGTVMTARFLIEGLGICRPQRRPAIRVLASYIVCRELWDAGRSRYVLGEAL
jgi:hypothetical protein